MTVRPRRPGDLAACVRALAAVHERDGYPARWPADPAGWLTPAGLLAAWVAPPEDTICGHVAVVGAIDDPQLVQAAGRAKDEVAAVSRLFVAPTARGQGVGASLLRAATTYAVERQLGLVLDVVDSRHSAAIALYERLGWQLVGHRPAGWVTADGVRPELRLYVLRGDAEPRDSVGAPGR